MINNVTESLDRLERYFSFVSACNYYESLYDWDDECDEDDIGVTVNRIADICQIPKKTVIDDLKIMLRSKASVLIPSEEYDVYEQKEDFWRRVAEDKIGFFPSIGKNKTFLSLTRDESFIIQKIKKTNNVRFDDDNALVIKEVITNKAENESLVHNIYSITEAIEEGKTISFTYGDKKTGKRSFVTKLTPLKLIYDAENNAYGVLSVYKKKESIFRLDGINNFSIESNNESLSDYSDDEIELLNKIPNIWGMSRFVDGIGVDVKVAFKNESKVWEKVKGYLEYRDKKRLYEDNGYLIYEDTVYGIDYFKSWVLSFGSSAIVVEPIELCNEILDIMFARIEKYSEEA